MDEIPKLKTGVTRHRWETAIKDKALYPIRDWWFSKHKPEHFLKVLERGSVSKNIYLRRIHNFALDMSWLPWPVPKKRWSVSVITDSVSARLSVRVVVQIRWVVPQPHAPHLHRHAALITIDGRSDQMNIATMVRIKENAQLKEYHPLPVIKKEFATPILI